MKYLALDIGNVLCSIRTQPFLDLVSESFNTTIPEAQRFLKRFQQLHDVGFTTMEDELKDHYDAKSPVVINKIVQSWNDSVIPYDFIINRLNTIRTKYDIKIALLSNIGVEHAELIKHKLHQGNFFQDAIIHFSCFVGARKPSLIFYQSFLIAHPEFQGCIYVDDLQENLDMAKQFEFQTFKLALNSADKGSKIDELVNMFGNP